MNSPVEPRIALDFQERRRLFKGIAGNDLPPETRLELLAARAVQRRARAERRLKNLREQIALRRAAVERRKKNQMLAAEYARDRRSGDTAFVKPHTKREQRRLRTLARIADRGREAST